MSANYILEVRDSTGALVTRISTDYQTSIVIEETLNLDLCSSYTVNVTVFVPSHKELGRHTNISGIDTSVPCHNEGILKLHFEL